jgi:hypothetical protein
MNSIPLWAKALGSVIGGVFVLFATFVTRPEFNALDARLASMQNTMNEVLLRVGGSPARLSADAVVDLQIKAWREAKKIAKTPKDKVIAPPPTTVFFEPRFLLPGFGRVCGWSYGFWNERRNRVVLIEVYVRPEETELLYAALVHEYLHFLLGLEQGRLADEQTVMEAYPAECPAE